MLIRALLYRICFLPYAFAMHIQETAGGLGTQGVKQAVKTVYVQSIASDVQYKA